MKYMDATAARERLRNVGAPDDMVQSFIFMYDGEHCVPVNVVDYTCKMLKHNPGWQTGEAIMTILDNATGSHGIFNVRKFYRELGPLTKKFGFDKDEIQSDIEKFDKDMQDYATAQISSKVASEKMNNPGILSPFQKEKIMDVCAAPKGKYYRAAIDFAVWYKLGMTSDESTLAMLDRFVGRGGVHIKRLMRLTTNMGEYEIVSRADGKTIKPKIKLQYIKYAKEVYRFFADNKVKIRHRAQKYEQSNADFICSFYKLCTAWDGWSWRVPTIKIETPGARTPMRDLVAMVIYDITVDLPSDARKMMANIAHHEMAKCVTTPAEQYEYIFDALVRVGDPKNRQK